MFQAQSSCGCVISETIAIATDKALIKRHSELSLNHINIESKSLFKCIGFKKRQTTTGVTVNNYSPKKITPVVIITQEKSTPRVIFSWGKFTPTWKKLLP